MTSRASTRLSMRNGLGDVHAAAAQAAGDPLGGVLLCHCMVGDADAAHRAVAATDSFREGLAAIAGKGDRDAERHARRRLRGHAKTAELEQRWNLPVYVELVRADLGVGEDVSQLL